MSKILSALIVGLFAASAFAAEAPVPVAAPNATQAAPSKVSSHKHHRHQRHHRHHKHHGHHHHHHHHAAASAIPGAAPAK